MKRRTWLLLLNLLLAGGVVVPAMRVSVAARI